MDEAFAIPGQFIQFGAHSGEQLAGLIRQRRIPGFSGDAIAIELNPQGQFPDKPVYRREPVTQIGHVASSPGTITIG
jgi:hypothetical protein